MPRGNGILLGAPSSSGPGQEEFLKVKAGLNVAYGPSPVSLLGVASAGYFCSGPARALTTSGRLERGLPRGPRARLLLPRPHTLTTEPAGPGRISSSKEK
jgi:hypothetical protein